MNLEQQITVAQQLERAAEIMRSDATDETKINTLVRIGSICTYTGNRWGDETFNKFLDTLDKKIV
jgi:hypothetical protein